MKTIIINDFCDLIPKLVENNKDTVPEYWFRGQKNSEWKLLPGAFRKDPELESQRLVRFKLYAPAIMHSYPDLNDYRKWLPIMQHFGTPTRLLDWSTSPLIALFFCHK